MKFINNPKLQNYLKNDIILPFKANKQQISFDNDATLHFYDIILYPFINHVTLEQIAFYCIYKNILNPKYFLRRNQRAWSFNSIQYKLRLLRIFYRVIQINIKLYQLQLIDLDIRYKYIIYDLVMFVM